MLFKLVALISGCLWLLSLFCTVFIYYDKSSELGYQILLGGWLGLFIGNFAWYANIFFLPALFFQIFSKKKYSAVNFSIVSLFLALDTIRFKGYPSGADDTLYGYGAGAVLWFSAIILLLLSVGIKVYSENETKNANNLSKLVFLLLTASPLFLFLIYSRNMALNYQKNGNIMEQKFRIENNVIIKKYRVCEANVIKPKIKFDLNNKPLEIISDSFVKPFDNPKKILDWGIPTVRIDDYDYFYSIANGKYTLAATPKFGNSVVAINIEQTYEQPYNIRKKMSYTDCLNVGKTIKITLTSHDRKNISFSQKWTTEVPRSLESNNEIMCPRYQSRPGVNDQPRKLIIESLIFDKHNDMQESSYHPSIINGKINGKIIGEKDVPITNKQHIKDLNCPQNIGSLEHDEWRSIYSKNPKILGIGKPYKVNETLFFPKSFTNSICSNKFIYLYKFSVGSGPIKDLHIFISKRSQSNFAEEFCLTISIKKLGSIIDIMKSHILSIREENNRFIVNLLDRKIGKTYRIEAFVDKH